MCGIFGAVHSEPQYRFDPDRVAGAMSAMAHRGPDDSGTYSHAGVVLASQRLAIVDLSPRGHMPMATRDGRYRIVHNGEIYNFQELRADLESRGHVFESNTDTEVLLALYVEQGAAMLARLNGMFAFAIWDTHDRRLFLARDRVGIKPLYYAEHGGALYFASEQKSLFAAGVPLRVSHDHWEELLCFRYVAGESTPFEGVRRLLPGHYMTVVHGRPQVRRWWSLAERARERRESLPPDAIQWFRDTFADSIRLRRISDVPVGVLLSGGLDSGVVAATLAAQASEKVASFTVRFDEPEYDESAFARTVATQWGLDYHDLVVPPTELLGRLRKAAWLNDEPLVHGSDLHLGAIADFAKPRVTVLLSGEGADETLGGYIRYQPLRYPRMLSAIRPMLPAIAAGMGARGRFQKLARFANLGSLDAMILFNSCDVLPQDLEQVGLVSSGGFPYREKLLAESRELYGSALMRRAMFVDQHTFLCSLLDRNDRMTMGASIECRVPFLDYRLIETLAALPSRVLLPGTQTKPLLRSSMGACLPDAVRSHKKWGFGVPWARYFRSVPELRDLVSTMPQATVFRDSPLDCSRIAAVVQEFLAGRDDLTAIVRQLVMMSVWHEVYVQPLAGDGRVLAAAGAQ